MKTTLLWILVLSFTLNSCTEGMNLHQTPALYFTSHQRVPATDTANNQMLGAAIQFPINLDLYYQHRVKENWILQAGYMGNLGLKIVRHAGLFRYSYTYHSLDGGAGYEFKMNQRNRLALMAGLGVGFSKSVVFEDWAEKYNYEGNFIRFHFTPVYSYRGGSNTFFLSWQQSLVNFKKYELPDKTYRNKSQFLTTPQIAWVIDINQNLKLGFHFGATLNGTGPGDRSLDGKFDVWRMEPIVFGFNAYRMFGK